MRTTYQIAMMAAVTMVPLYLGIIGCGHRHSPDSQEAAKPPTQAAAHELPSVSAIIRPSQRRGRLEIEVKNTGTQPLTFFDIQEGCASCDEFWEVEVRPESGDAVRPVMHYAPAGVPYKVSIEPGKSWLREIQPGAYVQTIHPQERQAGTIVIRYRVKYPVPRKGPLALPELTFASQPLTVKLTDYFD